MTGEVREEKPGRAGPDKESCCALFPTCFLPVLRVCVCQIIRRRHSATSSSLQTQRDLPVLIQSSAEVLGLGASCSSGPITLPTRCQ